MDFNTESLNRMSKEIKWMIPNMLDALDTPISLSRKYAHILICGMGASAIGGALFADSMYYCSNISVNIVKTMALPAWISKDTLFIACSYSGNTYETIKMYEQAIKANLEVIVVTHGGKLEELSKINNNQLVKIGGNLIQPRSAIGWFIGILGKIIDQAGGPDLTQQLKNLIPKIQTYNEEFEAEDSYAKKIARNLYGKTPVIYGSPDLESASLRMKTQLNENSKVIAFSGVLPEFNHNEIVGWYDDPTKSHYHIIIITDKALNEIAKIIEASKKLLISRNINIDTLSVKGDSILEKNIYAVMFGDYVSLYLAAIREIDPCNVDPIVDIKKRMNEALSQ